MRINSCDMKPLLLSHYYCDFNWVSGCRPTFNFQHPNEWRDAWINEWRNCQSHNTWEITVSWGQSMWCPLTAAVILISFPLSFWNILQHTCFLHRSVDCCHKLHLRKECLAEETYVTLQYLKCGFRISRDLEYEKNRS